MKVLHVIPTLNPKGGGPMEGIVQMAKVNQAKGVQIHVVCFDSPQDEFLVGLPITVHALGHGYGKYAYHPGLYAWLVNNLSCFDAVVINGIWQYHSFGTWRALKKVPKPYFVYTHGMLDPWFKKNYPWKHLKKWLYWPWADYRVLRDANAVLFTCEEERILAPRTFWLYKAREKVVKYGAANPPSNEIQLKNKFNEAFPFLSGKRIFLFLSRIHEKKGCDILIRAFSEISGADEKVQLVFVGPDQDGLKLKLENLAENLGISDRVSWLGMLRGDLKWGAFYASELFVLPSHQENFGIAVAEALGCGLPVVISNKVNIWREIEADGAGLVGNDDFLSTKINLSKWTMMPDEARRNMAEQARLTFLNRYTVDKMAESLFDVISEVVG